jgi:predicted Zn-dependent protease
MILRVVLASLALVVVAWLAIGLRNTDREQRGLELARSQAALIEPTSARKADDLLRGAEKLNPDPTPAIDRATLKLRLRQPGEALELVRPVVRDEPANLGAWTVLGTAALALHDKRLAARAVQRTRALSP